MLTASANGISNDNGQRCVELRRMPDGRWTIATGVSVLATGKSPWTPFTRESFATADDALCVFLAALPDDAALHNRAIEAFRKLNAR
jgi:hypothetical protein